LGRNPLEVIPSVVLRITVKVVNLIAEYIRALTINTRHKAMNEEMDI
jgi:hypothetical protein